MLGPCPPLMATTFHLSGVFRPQLQNSSLVFTNFRSCEKSCSRTIKSWGQRNNTCFQGTSLSFGCRQATRGLRSRICEVRKFVVLSAQSSTEDPSTYKVFEGLDASDNPVGICETYCLPPAISLEEAIGALHSAVAKLETNPPRADSGTLRFQVPLPPGLKALQWLQSQPQNPVLLPRSYFCPREARENDTRDTKNGSAKHFFKLDVTGVGGVAGVGAAVLFNGSNAFSLQDWKAIRRFLSKRHPIIRAYGAMRFDPKIEPSNEWGSFGSFYFFIPQIEFCECEGCSLLAVTLAWDKAVGSPFVRALRNALMVMEMVSTRICPDNERPLAQVVQREHVPDEKSWHGAVNEIVDSLSYHGVEYSDSAQQRVKHPTGVKHPTLSKVVMARRTKLEMNDQLDPVSLLACLQDRDPTAYQFIIQVPDGSAFIGCSPERLFARDGLLVASEAVAGTRARGSTSQKDLQLGMELMHSAKDHFEFEIVRESVKHHMEIICKHVKSETSKSLIKQARVQHLYSRFNGELHDEAGEFDLLAALHPTPAVCGHPQAMAREAISASEAFDRGLYAGPVGWFGGDGAEFAVGIRSSLIQPSTSSRSQNGYITRLSRRSAGQEIRSAGLDDDASLANVSASFGYSNPLSEGRREAQEGTCMFLYAGVGIVKDSLPASEWREMELKTRQFEALLERRQPLEEVVNINALWATLVVEECCRLGITYFCIAPGSRSSPLTAAAAAHPRVTCVSCLDERSMAFHAVGYGRGANKAAAIVTSSGTAVSNLLPAVVEASQDFVPLVILTADRPAELYDTGANQAIDQGKHFGGFVRYNADLPAADDKLPAKMVLTTVDAAVNRAMIAPSGPVHLNLAFREPLAGATAAWSPTCLKGLESWTVKSTPYTQYIESRPRLLGGVRATFVADLEIVANLIESARDGLLVVGGLAAAEETWAVALLAQHLGWPVVPDVISGLRIGEALYTEGVAQKKVNIVHNFDQILLSRDVAESSKPDVVLQIGSRLTSKRLAGFLEAANLQAYILVEDHSLRHDPAHIVTHRIQSSTMDFASTIMKVTGSKPPTTFCGHLLSLSKVVEREIHLKLQAESSLTEPFVAHYVVSCLSSGCALFLGNSMPIRDVNMYAHGAVKVIGSCNYEDSWDHALPHIGARVSANRGASGIDGVVSTAIGFAAGSRQRVTLLLGDVSFLHDTNGLALLSERTGQPPVTIVVVNNRGGGIFSLLPVADTVPKDSFTALFSTPHTVDLKKLCQAYRVGHSFIQSKEELKVVLQSIDGYPLNWVVEVESKIEDNAHYHRFLNESIGQAVTRAFSIVSKFSLQLGAGCNQGLKITQAKYDHHSFSLIAPPTTMARRCPLRETLRRGFLLTITLADGFAGIGEIAPLEGLHEETLLDVEEQLRVVVRKLNGRLVVSTLPLLDGSFSNWLLQGGIRDNSLFPSVRMGLEMAVLGALAASQGCSLLELLSGIPNSRYSDKCVARRSSDNFSVRICGLLNAEGSPEDAADVAGKLVKEGFCTLKLKVGRRASPLEDAAVLKLVRERVGPSINLRADANRKWSYEEAMSFASGVHSCGLQYLEEPLSNALDIPRFCEETGLLVALDESLDEDPINIEGRLQMYACGGVDAVVIKPGRVGGFEKAWQIAQWAQMQGMTVVISSAFESSISLAAYAQFAAYVDERLKVVDSATNTSRHERTSKETAPLVAHGFGTYKWLKDNPALQVNSTGNSVEIDIGDAATYLQRVCLSMKAVHAEEQLSIRSYNVDLDGLHESCSFHVLESAPVPSRSDGKGPTIVLLHGFMGMAKDWLPVMDGLSVNFRCVSVDLPGHGQTTVEEAEEGRSRCSKPQVNWQPDSDSCEDETPGAWSMEGLAAALVELLNKLDLGKVILVGYSMGARIAMHMALRHREQLSAAVIVSGSPGISNASDQYTRAAQDDALALSLRDNGLRHFVDWWYGQPLWKSLRTHPDFELMKRERVEHQDGHHLAKALVTFSTGRQPSLWDELAYGQVPLLLVVGKMDTKFVDIAHEMVRVFENEASCLKLSSTNWALPKASTEVLESGNRLKMQTAQGRNVVLKENSVLFQETNPRTDNSCRVGGCVPELLEVEDAGHAVHIESPLRLVKAIREFAMSLTW